MSIDVDIRCADLELNRLQDGFTGYDHTNFAAVLVRNFVETQATVHIITGSLRGSGEVDVDQSSAHRWEGHIAYGGSTAGPKNPVRYALAELYSNSARYPDHDYMRPTRHIDDELIGPVSSFISRGRRTPHPEAGQ